MVDLTGRSCEPTFARPMNPFLNLAFASPGVSRPVIPKRGEKDFEPKPGGGSGLQLHVLDTARAAMFEALRAKRTISRSDAS